MRNRNIRVVGCCQTVMLFDEFAIGGGNDEGRFLEGVFFHGFREKSHRNKRQYFLYFHLLQQMYRI